MSNADHLCSSFGQDVRFANVGGILRGVSGFDVLLIMDCCFAAGAFKTIQVKNMQALYAVASEEKATLSHERGHLSPTPSETY